MRAFACLIPAMLLVACAGGPAPASAPTCLPALAAAPAIGGCAGGSCALAQAPALAAAPVEELGVAYSMDTASYVRAGAAIPAGVVACGTQAIADLGQVVARFIVCAAASFTPPVTPTAHYVRVARPAAVPAEAPAPKSAGPCGR